MNAELSVAKESTAFLLFVLTGLTSGMLYAALKQALDIFSKNKKVHCIFEPIIIFSVLTFIIISFISINNLDMKFYAVSGIFLGSILYFLIFFKFFARIFFCFFIFFKKILKILLYPAHILCIILKRVFLLIKKMIKVPIKKIFLTSKNIKYLMKKI